MITVPRLTRCYSGPLGAERLADLGAEDENFVPSCDRTAPLPRRFPGSPVGHSTSDTSPPAVRFGHPRERATPTLCFRPGQRKHSLYGPPKFLSSRARARTRRFEARPATAFSAMGAG